MLSIILALTVGTEEKKKRRWMKEWLKELEIN
jgi:hypothetical protein